MFVTCCSGCGSDLTLSNVAVSSPGGATVTATTGASNSTPPQSQSPRRAMAAVPAGECDSLLDTNPRGVSCIHCLHPNARESAESILAILLKSCLKRPATNFLVDGSFGYDEDYLRSFIGRLTKNGRQPTVVLYMLNGASQRRHRTTQVSGIATQISPEKFRKQILKGAPIVDQIAQLADSIVPVASFAVERGAEVIVVPSLEDNLTDDTFIALFPIFYSRLALEGVKFARNPCPGCYPGNGSRVMNGLLRELHLVDPPSYNTEIDILSNDGVDFAFPWENSATIPLQSLSPMHNYAEGRGAVFILWNAEQQGITVETQSAPINPDLRVFRPYSSRAKNAVISWLREVQ